MTGNELKALISSSPNSWQRTFYDEYKNYVYTVVFNRLRRAANIEDIEECVADVFTDLLTDAEGLSAKDDLKGIVGLVAKRKAIDYYRRLSARRGDYDRLEEIADGSDMAADTEMKELRRVVLGCIAELGQPDSATLLMSYYYGLTSFQIGKKLEMKPSAVRKRRSRALDSLRRLLKEKGIDGEVW